MASSAGRFQLELIPEKEVTELDLNNFSEKFRGQRRALLNLLPVRKEDFAGTSKGMRQFISQFVRKSYNLPQLQPRIQWDKIKSEHVNIWWPRKLGEFQDPHGFTIADQILLVSHCIWHFKALERLPLEQNKYDVAMDSIWEEVGFLDSEHAPDNKIPPVDLCSMSDSSGLEKELPNQANEIFKSCTVDEALQMFGKDVQDRIEFRTSELGDDSVLDPSDATGSAFEDAFAGLCMRRSSLPFAEMSGEEEVLTDFDISQIAPFVAENVAHDGQYDRSPWTPPPILPPAENRAPHGGDNKTTMDKPFLEISHLELEWKECALGEEGVKSLTLFNKGEGDVHIKINFPEPEKQVFKVNDMIGGSVTMAQSMMKKGEKLEVRLVFAPEAIGRVHGILQVESCVIDENNNRRTKYISFIPVSGIGA